MLRFLIHNNGGLLAQAVRRSPPTAGVLSSRLGHSMWVSWWTKRGFSRGFSRFPLPQISFHHSYTLISSISSALVMVRQAWSASTLATHGPIIYIGGSSHLIPRPDLVLDTSWGYFYLFSSDLSLNLPKGLLPSSLLIKTLYAFLYYSIRATCPAHLTRLALKLLIILVEELILFIKF